MQVVSKCFTWIRKGPNFVRLKNSSVNKRKAKKLREKAKLQNLASLSAHRSDSNHGPSYIFFFHFLISVFL